MTSKTVRENVENWPERRILTRCPKELGKLVLMQAHHGVCSLRIRLLKIAKVLYCLLPSRPSRASGPLSLGPGDYSSVAENERLC